MLAIEECDRYNWDQVFKMVLRSEEPSTISTRRFNFSDLYKLFEIELKEIESDPRIIQNILNIERKETLTKAETTRFNQVIDLFDKDYH